MEEHCTNVSVNSIEAHKCDDEIKIYKYDKGSIEYDIWSEWKDYQVMKVKGGYLIEDNEGIWRFMYEITFRVKFEEMK